MSSVDSAAQYSLVAHPNAMAELGLLNKNTKENFVRKFDEASLLKKPTEHSSATLLGKHNGLFRIREGDYRAICDKSGPQFRVLLIDHRSDVYDRIAEAKRRKHD